MFISGINCLKVVIRHYEDNQINDYLFILNAVYCDKMNSMNRHEQRIYLMEIIYKHRLLENDLLTSFREEIETDKEYDNFIFEVIEDLSKREDDYIKEIEPLLNKWSFERLNKVEQAILLISVSELKLGLNDKAVVIDEALKLAKKYCEPDSYKYMNGVLDNI